MAFFNKNRRGRYDAEIAPDEIFLDSSNLPEFDTDQFEGRIDKPIARRVPLAAGLSFLAIGLIFLSQVAYLELAKGQQYADQSEQNHLRQTPIISERGAIYDRNGVVLAQNVPNASSTDFSLRQYSDISGIGHVLGYVQYPKRDSSGVFFQDQYLGADGVEKGYNDLLQGQNGMKIIEVNALNRIQSESVTQPAVNGKNLTLTVDSRLESGLYSFIKATAEKQGFSGGSAVIMDVTNGQMLALTNYPEYSPQVMSDGGPSSAIRQYVTAEDHPFLNRAVDCLYTPGSIIKPFVALAALNEGVIDPAKQILSTGSISIPNQYDPTKSSVFTDWRPQGWVDMKQALAVSSDVYFYEVGGGYQDQKGIGIANIEKYARLFGFGSTIPGDSFFEGKKGTIPDPEWKALNFSGEQWRIGDTYHTAIGQYGFQVTPVQAVRAVAAIANGGALRDPEILLGDAVTGSTDVSGPVDAAQDASPQKIDIPQKHFDTVREGMRQAVTEGIAKGLNVSYVQVAAKTGTAELGTAKKLVNSWVVGFFPYDHPKYAFAVMMEKGPRDNTIGGLFVMRSFLDWMNANAPEYLR